jgi:eukaryotic-like serine/threonine-protein kinase
MDPQSGPPQPDLLIGKTIGNYLVTQKLGEGGMGSVYLAEHPSIGKKVALKVLHSEFSSNQEVAARFFNEAKAVNDIGHPNIVDIVDFGIIPAGPGGLNEQLVYFIMEYLSGQTLSGLIRNEAPLPPERAFTIALQVADALAASHKCGIVHRDLKPDNIMLQRRGRDADFVKLLDFGIAKLTGDATGSRRTRTGIVMGTPAYMSPEQCEGRGNIDHRTDVYALGIVVYEMLTGRVPFIGEGYGEILVQHLTQPPVPPSQFRMMSPHVEAVVMKALEKRPDMRYPSMDEMMRALADPVGYVEANGGLQGFLKRQLTPSNAPIPSRLTPAPASLSYPAQPTPIPGMLTPHGVVGHGGHAAPTTLGSATGQVGGGTSGKKVGFIVAGVLVVAAAAVAIIIVISGGGGVAAGSGSGSSEASGSDPGSAAVTNPPSDSATPTPGNGTDMTVQHDAGPGSGSAIAAPGPGSSTPPEPATTMLRLTTTPPGAKIYIDGVEQKQKTPGAVEKLARKPVKLVLKLAGYDDITLDKLELNDEVVAKEFVFKKKSGGGVVIKTGGGNTGKGSGTTPGKGSNTGKGSGTTPGKGSGNDTGLEKPGD